MTGGVITRSGRIVTPDSGVPSLDDIGYSLASIQRFGGYTRRPWSVAHHSFVVADIAARDWNGDTDEIPYVRLAALLHDAAESLTGDIPTPFKTLDMRVLQKALDRRIFDAFFPDGYELFQDRYSEAVHKADHAALLAEAYRVGPRAITRADDVVAHFGAAPTREDIDVVRLLEKTVGRLDARWAHEAGDLIRYCMKH